MMSSTIRTAYFMSPTYGYIGSDNMLFSEGNFPDPYFAVGRIAARTPDDIRNYLDKVREYEQAPFTPQTIEDKYWMKRVMNLGGGKNDQEQNDIRKRTGRYGILTKGYHLWGRCLGVL
jgi:hypothetical protein